MGIRVAKDSIDVGIVVTDGEQALAFYRDALGLPLEETRHIQNGGLMYRFRCGTSLIKVLAYPKPPPGRPQAGGIRAAAGIRYLTLTVSNLRDALDRCKAAGYAGLHPPYDNGRGLIIGSLFDPDGNQVELVQDAATWQGPRPGSYAEVTAGHGS